MGRSGYKMLLWLYVTFILLIHYGFLITYSISLGRIKNKWFAVLLPMMPVASVIYFFIAPDSASFLLLILSILYFIPLCFINGINLLWLEHQSSVNGPIAKAKDHPYGDQVMFLI